MFTIPTDQEQYTPYGAVNYVMRINDIKDVIAKIKMIYRTKSNLKNLGQAARKTFTTWAEKYMMGGFSEPNLVDCRQIIKHFRKHKIEAGSPNDYDMTCEQKKNKDDKVNKSKDDNDGKDGSYGFAVHS